MDNPVAAAEGGVRLRSNRKPACTMILKNQGTRLYGGCATGRSLRQLLRSACIGLEISAHA